MVKKSAPATTNVSTGMIIARLDMHPLSPENLVVIGAGKAADWLNARPEHCRGRPAPAHRRCSTSARCADHAGAALSPVDPLFAGVKSRRLLRPAALRPDGCGIR